MNRPRRYRRAKVWERPTETFRTWRWRTLGRPRSAGHLYHAVQEKPISDAFVFVTRQEKLVGSSGSEELVARLQADRIQLHSNLQRCMYEIQQRDQYFQQLNQKVRKQLNQDQPQKQVPLQSKTSVKHLR